MKLSLCSSRICCLCRCGHRITWPLWKYLLCCMVFLHILSLWLSEAHKAPQVRESLGSPTERATSKSKQTISFQKLEVWKKEGSNRDLPVLEITARPSGSALPVRSVKQAKLSVLHTLENQLNITESKTLKILSWCSLSIYLFTSGPSIFSENHNTYLMQGNKFSYHPLPTNLTLPRHDQVREKQHPIFIIT